MQGLTVPPPKLEYLLLSEDARLDQSGLLNITGLIPTSVNAPGPVVLPKLVATAVLSGMENISEVRVSSEIKFSADRVIGSAPGDWITITPKAELTHFQHFMMVPLSDAGEYVFRLR